MRFSDTRIARSPLESLLGVVIGTGVAVFTLGTAAPGGSEASESSVGVRINEVLPNPEGLDQDTGPKNGGNEVIELTNTSLTAVDLENWRLKDAEGNTLIQFGAGVVIPGRDTSGEHYYLVVVLGASYPSGEDPAFDDPGSPYTRVVFLTSDQGDLIDNDSEALVLEDDNGSVVDALLFGISEPTGLEVDKAKAAGHWSGPRFDTGFSSGGVPLAEGYGVLGRDRLSSDSHTGGDWRSDGGADALGSTLGQENGPDRYQSTGALIHGIQGYVNQMAIMISIHNSTPLTPYLGLHSASFANVSLSRQGDDYTVVADHLFGYSILGQPTGVLAGTFTAVYSPVAGSSDQLDVAGVLADPVNGYSMSLSFQEALSGFGSASHALDLTIDLTWSDPSDSYSYHNEASQVLTWASQDTLAITDHREYWDWSSPSIKVSDATHTVRFLDDGVTDTIFSLVRTDPMVAAAFGETHVVGSRKNVVEAEYRDCVGADGDTFREYRRFDILIEDPGQPRKKVTGLRPGELGTLSISRVSGPVGDATGEFITNLSLPLNRYRHQDRTLALTRVDVSSITDVTKELVSGPMGEAVFVERGSIDVLSNGRPEQHFDFYVDGWRRWVIRGCQGLAAGACAAAGVASGPTVVGSFVSAAGSALVIGYGEHKLEVLDSSDVGGYPIR